MRELKPDQIFAAMADPVRCEIVTRLAAGGPQPTAGLLRDLGLTRQGAARHLAVLEKSGLIESRKHGREVLRRLNGEYLRGGVDWLEQIGAKWDAALGRLAAQYQQETEDDLPIKESG